MCLRFLGLNNGLQLRAMHTQPHITSVRTQLAAGSGSTTVLTVMPKAAFDLLAQPEATIQTVCDFLGEEMEPALLAHEKTPAAKKGAALSESWQNTGGPILKSNSGKYRTALSEAEIAQVEQAAGEMMDALGYERDGEPAAAPGALGMTQIQVQDTAWTLQVEGRSLLKDANHWRRWKRAVLMGWLGWWRSELDA